MSKKERKKLRIITKKIRESEEFILELSDSVDSVSPAARSLKNIKPFLEQLHQEVTEKLPNEILKEARKSLASKTANFFLILLLQPAIQLLIELLGKAVKLGSRILGRE